jgi:hypothetical protein
VPEFSFFPSISTTYGGLKLKYYADQTDNFEGETGRQIILSNKENVLFKSNTPLRILSTPNNKAGNVRIT